MKKIIMFIVIIIFIVFVTGCTGKANIIMDYKGTVSEEVNINEINGNIIYGNYSLDESIDLFLKKYEKSLKVSNYSINKYNNKYDSGVKIEKKYKNICDYANNTIFSQYIYKAIRCKENDLFYELYNEGNVVQNSYEDYKEMPDTRVLSIKLPISATEQNADEIDGTTYIWKYDKDTENKNFYLKISKSSLKEYQKEYEIKQEKNRNIRKIVIISVILGIVVIIGVVSYMFYKRVQKNKFDY